MSTETLKHFIALGKSRGFIGGMSTFERTLEFLSDPPEKIEFAGPTGDVALRLYWEDIDHRGDLVGGCISIPNIDL